jgi:hypothetical protein
MGPLASVAPGESVFGGRTLLLSTAEIGVVLTGPSWLGICRENVT